MLFTVISHPSVKGRFLLLLHTGVKVWYWLVLSVDCEVY